jgi:hypothetical protein
MFRTKFFIHVNIRITKEIMLIKKKLFVVFFTLFEVMSGKVRLINAIVSQNLLKIIYFLT